MFGTATAPRSFDYECQFNGEYAQIPAHMQEAIRRYVVRGLQPGDFLTAVITNDLLNAVNRADADNLPLLKLYVRWFYNEAPAPCWGSRQNMAEWCARWRH